MYMTFTHLGPQGNPLALTTVLVYLGLGINMAKRQSSTVPTDEPTRHITTHFFTCLVPRASTDSARWFRRLKDWVCRWGFQRSRDDGVDMDHSDTPVYPEDMGLICRALALHGAAEAAEREGLGALCMPRHKFK